jgi:hypothetical protein
MLFLQLGLIATGVLLVLGQYVYFAGIACAGLRYWQTRIFGLNDFHFFAVMTFLIAHGEGGPFRSGRRQDALGRPIAPKNPKWVRDVLLAQLAFVYAATAWLKLGPAWIAGNGIFVRTTYLKEAIHWPYPGFVASVLGSKAADAWLARAAVLSELALAVTIVRRKPYWLAVALAVGIHAFGAFATNVWFFSAVMVASVVLLVPRERAARVARDAKREKGILGEK